MWRRPVVTILMLVTALLVTLPMRAQQKPFTQEQVSNMVRDGFGDESGAKLIEQRGIDFVPLEEFIQSLKAAGASEAFLKALRAAKPPEPASAKKPLNQLQIFALLAGQVPTHRVTMLVQERAIDFEPKDDYLQQIRIIGGDDELISALKNAKVIKPPNVELGLQAQYLHDEMWDEALASLREAVSKQQFDPVLRLALGETLFRTGDYEQAIRELGTAKKLDADLWQATQRMADAHLKIWELKKSLSDRELACDLYHELPSSVSVNGPNSARIAALFPKWNDETSANSEAQSTLAELESPMGTWVSDRGEVYTLRGGEGGWSLDAVGQKSEDSLSAFSTVPATGGTLTGQGVKRTSFCNAILSIAIHTTQHATMMEVTAFAQSFLSEDLDRSHQTACRDLTQTMEGIPFLQLKLVRKDDAAHTNLRNAHSEEGDSDGAIAEQREAVRLNPNNDMAHNNLGAALENKGDLDGGIAEYREALRLNPDNELAHVNLGHILGLKADWDGMIAEEREALRLNPRNDRAHAYLGAALGKKGDLDGAIAEIHAAYMLDPKNPLYKQTYERLLQYAHKR
jgi:tetratricopeptide (TPR) repeat protein